ncbi:PREDICTED: serine/threonine-protein phosphatase 6 regulatory ankyrin repeat subunit B-like [Ipomoea nil]|uniref:serine/threonine-protein phosphatase 6 regulatory ankyrin repeat subunit B-like n=1 Tax=Ipomoea nil TaxID=35883 RepID=UPI000901B895|nr:PREDICTED: serine/threonine-protein phosphatase 6 regulatory ankyrin repeat subunit B-like [Ipomoea nil]
MAAKYFPLRWESTGDQWWFASPIDWAAANGHYDLVRELLHLDPNLLIKLTSLRRIRRLETLWDDEEHLGGAVAICRAQVAKKLLYESETKKGQTSLIRAGYGGWLLYTAASAGDLEFVRELVGREPLLVYGEGEYGVTDMFYAAARSKDCRILRLLLDCCVSSPKPKGSGELSSAGFKKEMVNRAVHAAARGGNVEVLRELLGNNCSNILDLDYRDDQGATLLHSASGRGQVEVVKSLLASYDDISNSRDKLGNTALHVAAYRGYLAVVEVLASASSSSVSLTNDHGDTFLHMAVAGFNIPSFRRLDRQIELMKQLVSGEVVNIEGIINVRNNDGKTALHVAVMDSVVQTDLVELLMTVPSIDLNICDAEGNTPLDLLKQHPQSASSEILIKRFVSAGGISNFRDHTTRSAIVPHRKTHECIIGSPGTSFRMSDAEVFVHAGVENNVSDDVHSGLAGTDDHETTQMSPCHSVAGSNSSQGKKSASVNSAARRLKALLQRAWRKEAIEKDCCVESHTGCLSLAEKPPPIPLRQRFSATPSLADNQETTPTSSLSPSSPSSKKKFGGGLRCGVFQATPRSSFGSPLSVLSGSSWASPASLSQARSGDLGNTSSVKLFHNGEKSKMKRKYNSLNMRLVNKYLCFGAQGLAMEHNPSNSKSCNPQDEFYKHPVVA